MSPQTALGIEDNRFLEGDLEPAASTRRISLDPRIIRNVTEPIRTQTPVAGLDYSTVRQIKLKFDTGAKIISAIRKTLEVCSGPVDDEQFSELISYLLDNEVILFTAVVNCRRNPKGASRN